MDGESKGYKSNISKWLMLIPVINIMLLLIIKTSVIAFETVYIIWSIFSYIIFIAYMLNKIKEFKLKKSIFEENIEQKEKLLQKSEEDILKIQQENMDKDKLFNIVKDNLINITNLLERFMEKLKTYSKKKVIRYWILMIN